MMTAVQGQEFKIRGVWWVGRVRAYEMKLSVCSIFPALHLTVRCIVLTSGILDLEHPISREKSASS